MHPQSFLCKRFFAIRRSVPPSHPAELPTGRVLDAGALKALAHPLRFRLLELLLWHGPDTASGLGRQVGESSGSTSYHLRQLADHGLIEEAPELGSARDRYWKAVEGGWTLEGFEMLQQPETRADATLILDELRQARAARLARWHQDGPSWGSAWVAASIDLTARLALTVEETAELRDQLLVVLDEWRHRVGHRRDTATCPEDAAMVNVDLDVFPIARLGAAASDGDDQT
jgi:DNA-binding transcriptional ArsR family regulator